jgi:hypothetical protein
MADGSLQFSIPMKALHSYPPNCHCYLYFLIAYSSESSLTTLLVWQNGTIRTEEYPIVAQVEGLVKVKAAGKV